MMKILIAYLFAILMMSGCTTEVKEENKTEQTSQVPLPTPTAKPSREAPTIKPPYIELNEGVECNESEYWQDIDADNPYPGMNCSSGPKKTIGLTIFIPKDPRTDKYVVEKEEAEFVFDKLNSAFNEHGIEFKLTKIVLSEADTSKYSDLDPKTYGNKFKEKLLEYFDAIYDGQYDSKGINIVFISDWHGVTASCSHPWNVGEKFGKHRCYSLPHKIPSDCLKDKDCRKNKYSVMIHEVGHFLGLVHTHHPNSLKSEEELKEDFEESGPSWISVTKTCHKDGDYICDTNYDCYTYCQEALGCEGISYTKTHKYESKCGPDYAPPTDNYMSYYSGSKNKFTKEQGARARYYLMQRINNEINGNKLEEIE